MNPFVEYAPGKFVNARHVMLIRWVVVGSPPTESVPWDPDTHDETTPIQQVLTLINGEKIIVKSEGSAAAASDLVGITGAALV